MADESLEWRKKILVANASLPEQLDADIAQIQQEHGVDEAAAVRRLYSQKRASGEITDADDLYGLGGR